MKKGVEYLKENGLINFAKRLFVNLKFKGKTEYKSNSNLYKIKNGRKTEIIAKKGKMVSILYEKDNFDLILDYANTLNSLGCKVELFTNQRIFDKIIYPFSNISDLDEFDEKKFDFVFTDVKRENNHILIKKNQNILEKCNSIIFHTVNSSKTKYYNNISIIVLNYNNDSIIQKCLDSLIRYNDYSYEIVVIDNQSQDGSYEKIIKNYKNIIIGQNTKNGCSSGRNLGVALATKEYILFLDSDQWVTNRFWLENYLKIYSDEIGAIGWTGGWFNKKGYAEQIVDNFAFRNMPPWGLYRTDIGYLGTGGMFVRKRTLKDIGLFDVMYDPTCYEDTDISLKIREKGLRLVYCPYLGILHKPHQTTNSGSSEHQELITEKRTYFLNKWKNKKELLRYIK